MRKYEIDVATKRVSAVTQSVSPAATSMIPIQKRVYTHYVIRYVPLHRDELRKKKHTHESFTHTRDIDGST